jgi:hypothetical protein
MSLPFIGIHSFNFAKKFVAITLGQKRTLLAKDCGALFLDIV